MKPRARVHPELEVLRDGRQFRRRPNEAVVQAFLQHVWNTGSPQTWRWITTTPHPEGEAPLIITSFRIPERLRGGLETRAPCAICSPQHPKFDHGFLVHCSDGRLRIIGHECGHDFFTGDSYAAALKEHEAENAEASARDLLAERLPDLSRTLVEAAATLRDVHALLDFQERAVSGITKKAAAAMRRARIGDQLTVEVEAGAVDERGRGVVEKRVVAVVEGLDALTPQNRLLADLMSGVMAAAQVWIVERDEIAPRLAAMTREDLLATAKALRRLDEVLEKARTAREDFRRLLSGDGLRGLSTWGRHCQCPTPFWIEIVDGRRVYLGKGLRPKFWDRGFHLSLPPPEAYAPLTVT